MDKGYICLNTFKPGELETINNPNKLILFHIGKKYTIIKHNIDFEIYMWHDDYNGWYLLPNVYLKFFELEIKYKLDLLMDEKR